MKKGERVGAVMNTSEKEVNLFGFGIYAGREIPPPGIKFLGIPISETGAKNPKIILDNGKIVWGCECWWGPEEKVKNMIGERKIVEVDIEKERV